MTTKGDKRRRRLFEGVDDDLRRRARDPNRTGPPLEITVRDGQVIFHEETGDRVVTVRPRSPAGEPAATDREALDLETTEPEATEPGATE